MVLGNPPRYAASQAVRDIITSRLTGDEIEQLAGLLRGSSPAQRSPPVSHPLAQRLHLALGLVPTKPARAAAPSTPRTPAHCLSSSMRRAGTETVRIALTSQRRANARIQPCTTGFDKINP